MSVTSLYFDQQDHELLHMVNRILERDRKSGREPQFFAVELHPHGIKELAVSRELRVAYAVINLLESLEEGEADERLIALRSLHDEVLYTAASSYRMNTARVLIQIMKDLVRAHGDPEKQILLARDFREAASGKRRIVRAMLNRYHLLEMPESWDQLTFDNHVHDANTKGRKTPTHLIMDAWIKGIRSLTVIYYNFVNPMAVQELIQAAEIMGVHIRIGVEFKAMFRGKYVEFIWEPFTEKDDIQDVLELMQEDEIRDLMEDGRAASAFQSRYVFGMLERYNGAHRTAIGKQLGIALHPISEQEFLSFVGIGQPSLLHLAELVYKRVLPKMEARLESLREDYPGADAEEKARIDALLDLMREVNPEYIMETWFTPEMNQDLPSPDLPATGEGVPALLKLTPHDLLHRLADSRRRSRIVLTLSKLSPEDVLELLYDCEGMITHLELFNLKDYTAGEMIYSKEINALQLAINRGSSVELKRQIRSIIQSYGCSDADDAEERCEKLTEILRNIPRLLYFYKRYPLKSRVGSDSTSRSFRLHGMGFAFVQTLPASAQKSIRDPRDQMRQTIPLKAQIDSSWVYAFTDRPKESILTRLIRMLPGFAFYGYAKKHDWIVRTESTQYTEKHGCISTLGGFQRPEQESISLTPRKAKEVKPTLAYMNTRLANILKVVVGFTLATCTFMYTQEWWVLAYFGALIWFTITGLRNIVQAVLGGGGLHRTPLLRWNDYVSWSRICDSLLYTGISVPLLELTLRYFILGKTLNITASTSPVIFFTVISVANGLYIASHNIYRGLPKEAVIGNLFRSVLAIPVSLVYNFILTEIITLFGSEAGMVLLQQGAAIVSKAASDTVAGVIEGFGDQAHNMRMRYWDYTYKLKQLFSCFARLEVLLPEEDVLELLNRPRELMRSRGEEVAELEKAILIHSLDLMYFWMYQPRGRTMLTQLVRAMPVDEKAILARSQVVLCREREVSQLFVDGIVGNNFPKPLAFFLDRHREYLDDIMKLTGEKQVLEAPPSGS